MKVSIAAFLVSIAAIFAAPAFAEEYAPGRILVEVQRGNEVSAIASQHGAIVSGRIPGLNVSVLNVPNGKEKQTVAALRKNPKVKFAELDEKVAPNLTTNDPSVGSQWHLPKINAPIAWDRSTGTGVVIAILDTGVDPNHPDLIGKLVPGWNFFDNNSDTSDVYGHGTPVAGSAAATGNNGIGVSSVAFSAKIMPIRISGTDGYAYFSTIANGLSWAVDNGARVANISYGVSGSASVRAAADKMQAAGGLVTVSAMNTGANTGNTQYDSLIVVSATNKSDVKTSWSSYGSDVDVSAPGEGIYTTVRGGSYGSKSGTSFAAPIVAGSVAVIKSLRPDLTPEQIRQVLYTSATDLGVAGRDDLYGNGRVDLWNAVVLATSVPTNPTPEPPPVVDPVTDTIGPDITISGVSNGQRVNGKVNISASATDTSDVAWIQIEVAGVAVASSPSGSVNYSWDVRRLRRGEYTITVTAEDRVGNRNAKTITVTKK